MNKRQATTVFRSTNICTSSPQVGSFWLRNPLILQHLLPFIYLHTVGCCVSGLSSRNAVSGTRVVAAPRVAAKATKQVCIEFLLFFNTTLCPV